MQTAFGRRILHADPQLFSFLAGILVSLATNLATSVALTDKLPISVLLLVLCIALLLVSSILSFAVSIRLAEVRGELSLIGPRASFRDLDELLKDKARSGPIVALFAWSLAAVIASLVALLLVSSGFSGR